MAVDRLNYYLSPETMELMCHEISKGIKISTLCDKYSITPLYFTKSFEKNPLFSEMFFSAKKSAAMITVEGIEDMIVNSETREEIARARILADNQRWIASKHARDIYGEKMDVAITNTLDLSAVLKAANARVVPMLDQQDTTHDVIEVISTTYNNHTTGLEPVVSISSDDFEDLL